MLRLLLASFLMTGLISGEDLPPAVRAKARSLLEAASEGISAARVQTQVFGLLHLGENYQDFDRKKAVAYLGQAFAVAATVSDDNQDTRGQLQAEIVSAAAEVDVAEAIALLRRLGAPRKSSGFRNAAVEQIVEALLKKPDFDAANDVLAAVPADGEYPIHAAGLVLKRLPKGDQRRVLVFGRALSAYTRHPGGPLAELLAPYWREFPAPMVHRALDAAVQGITDAKDELKNDQHFTVTDKGPIEVREKALLNLLGVVRAVDPKRADKLMATYPKLKDMTQRFPGEGVPQEEKAADENNAGPDDSADDGDYPMSLPALRQLDAAASMEAVRQWKVSNDRAEVVLAMAEEDREKALSEVDSIPLADHRVQVLGSIVAAGGTDPSALNELLSKCASLLAGIKEPERRVSGWMSIAEMAHRAGDDKRAWESVTLAVADARTVYGLDTDSEHPNFAMQEHWPSIQLYRNALWRTAKMFGVDAEQVLAGIADPDLLLLALIDLAEGLLGRHPAQISIEVGQ